MSKPNFFRFKRKFNNSSPGAPSAKQLKKDEASKGQTTISKFFMASKQGSKKSSDKAEEKPMDMSNGSSDVDLCCATVSKDSSGSSVALLSASPAANRSVRSGLGNNTIDKLRKFTSVVSHNENQETVLKNASAPLTSDSGSSCAEDFTITENNCEEKKLESSPNRATLSVFAR